MPFPLLEPFAHSTQQTESCDRNRGNHRVEDEIIHPDRPDFILHDSGGFEAGDVSQIKSVENFVKRKASRTDLAERLHVIWYVLLPNLNEQAYLRSRFCVEMNSTRTKQTATNEVFKAVSTYATDIPVIVVVTKSDEFRGSQFLEGRAKFETSITDAAQLMSTCDVYAANQVQTRIELIRSEMQEVEGGRFDTCVGISKSKNTTLNVSFSSFPRPINT